MVAGVGTGFRGGFWGITMCEVGYLVRMLIERFSWLVCWLCRMQSESLEGRDD